MDVLAPAASSEPASSFRATLDAQGWSFDAPAHQTLMKSARRAGIDLPRSCQNGTCRTCLCQMIKGRVRYRLEWPGVTPDEQAEGLILPCVALPLSDVVLQVPGATARLRE